MSHEAMPLLRLVLRQVVAVVRDHAGGLAVLVLVVVLFELLLDWGIGHVLPADLPVAPGPETTPDQARSVFALAMGALVGPALLLLLTAPVTDLALRAMDGAPAAAAGSVGRAAARVPGLLGLTLLVGGGIALGLVCLVVPGLMLLARWSLAVPVMLAERLGPLSAMRRSAELTYGHRWPLFGLFVLRGIVGSLPMLLGQPVKEEAPVSTSPAMMPGLAWDTATLAALVVALAAAYRRLR